MKTGLYPGLSRAEYERIDAVNVSTLAHFERSSMHAREKMLHPDPPTAAMILGTIFHCAVLEPERFKKDYAVAPECDRRTKEGKAKWAEFEAENPHAEIVKAEDYATILKMRDSVWAHPTAKQILGGKGHNEVGLVFDNPETGLRCKGLMDRLTTYDDWTWVIDLKRTNDAAPRGFSKTVKALYYAARAAFYVDGCNIVAPRDRRFAWIAVEPEPPYAVAIYEPDAEALAAGRSRYMRWLRNYQEATTTGVWPGYDVGIWGMGAQECEFVRSA